MLEGKELGLAIKEAIELKKKKGVKVKDIAKHFEIKPPSLYDWMKKGTISKGKLDDLFDFFSDVVGDEHWGLKTKITPATETDTAGKVGVVKGVSDIPGDGGIHEPSVFSQPDIDIVSAVASMMENGVTPRTKDKLIDIAQKAKDGKLSEDDILLLGQIADRIEKK